MISEEIKNEIIEHLLPLNPEKVILFGSYVYGNPTADSDVVLGLTGISVVWYREKIIRS